MRARSLNVEHLVLLPDGGGWLLAEVGSNDPGEADARAEALLAALPSDVTRRRYDDADRQARVWMVRESGLGATAITSGGRRNHEGWEDAAVAPERLGEYLRAITRMWTEFGYHGAWYGHFGQGCVHTRNDFDFTSPEGVRAFRSYVEQAADLVISLGGSLSGEHGDGQARGELLGRMYGDELLEGFRAFKAVFDPRGRMNPGKLIDARPLDADLRFGPAYRVSSLGVSQLRFGDAGNSLQRAAERCVGVGRCRRDDAGTMCPSYRATRDERYSTRGRSKLLVELFQGDVTPESWRNRDIRAALDLCLSCKGCVVDCPTQVDMASYKAEFLSHYYRRHLRPRSMYAFGLLPWALRMTARTPWVLDTALGAPGLGHLARTLLGVTTARPVPRLAAGPFRRSAAARTHRDDPEATVVVWPDTFTNAFRPSTADDLIAALEACDERVAVPSRWGCCGRPLYDVGMLGLARRTLSGLLDVLEPWASRSVPIVVPEPSCLAALRDELPSLLWRDPRAARLSSLARSPSEHLLLAPGFRQRLTEVAAGAGKNGWSDPKPKPRRRVVVHPQCQGRAAGLPAADRSLLQSLGLEPEVLDAGCCGLAGSFGYSGEREGLSRQIGEEQWLPGVRAAVAEGDVLVVDGFSCAMQLAHLSDLPSTTLIAVVRQALEV